MSRYIDADALKKTFNEFPCLWVQYTIAGHTDKDIENIVDDVLKQAKQTIISEINEQPTADVVDRNECSKCVLYPFKQLRERLEANMVEVVHGEWIVLYDEDSPQDGIWKCSMCDYIRFIDDITPTNYCPNCGAKMDKE